MIKQILIIIIAVLTLSCGKHTICKNVDREKTGLIYYACGYNSLTSYIKEDISQLTSGYLPTNASCDNILFIYSHLTKYSGNYKIKTAPSLTRVYKDKNSGKVVKDTLWVLPEETISASAKTMNEVLNFIQEKYPDYNYGMIFSSHATGWLPAGYYSNSNFYDKQTYKLSRYDAKEESKPKGVPYVEPEYDPNAPMVKSVGQDVVGALSYEMTIKEFAEAIPMHLDYILFDVCLMGGVEVAYELKDKCDFIGFSPTEVLAEGYDYTKLGKAILSWGGPNPQKLCQDFFTYYDSLTGQNRSATISYVETKHFKELGDFCKIIFDKYRANIENIDYTKVQRYYRYNYHWFYDLRSIIENLGATESELSNLDTILDKCILYKDSTEEFIGIKIESYSGLSMYLPSHGSEYLNNYYQELEWNKTSKLVCIE